MLSGVSVASELMNSSWRTVGKPSLGSIPIADRRTVGQFVDSCGHVALSVCVRYSDKATWHCEFRILLQAEKEERLIFPIDNNTTEEERHGTLFYSHSFVCRSKRDYALSSFASQVSLKREQMDDKSVGARNDYLLSLATANAHQTRYFVSDLQNIMQV